LYGDTQSSGMVITGCQDSYVYGGYIEAYPDTVLGFPAGINIIGPQAVRWMFRDVVFDYIGGFPMRAVRISTDGTGYPGSNKFKNCLFAGTNYPARNFVEGVVYDYTAAVTLGTSGTCTLTSGEGGDLCHYVLNGRMCTAYGLLSVDSVSSPVGAIQVSLPFICLNEDSNYPAASIAVSGFTSGMVANGVGSAIRAFALMSVNGFASGSQVFAGSWLQAGATISFSVTYPIAD
jgi:hypothetical protein